jgi:hypothetical protein
MTATNTGPSNIEHNVNIAERFVKRIEGMTPDDRARISTQSFGSTAHTSAMLTTADEITALKNKDRDGRLSAFLVDAEQRIDAMQLDATVGGLVKAAVRALLVHDLPDREKPTRQLYTPFEPIIPLRSLEG